jgi:hypothetical protein
VVLAFRRQGVHVPTPASDDEPGIQLATEPAEGARR